MKVKERLKTKLEECRQALQIHGGPINLCAASLGVRLSRLPIPSRRLRCALYRKLYGKKYPPLDESELEHSLGSYRSLNALFTRGIRPELRPIAQTDHQILCPCDGMVQDIGRLVDGKLLTVKGIEYTASSLLAGTNARAFQDGHYAIIFLSPRDCHRVFSPHDGYCRQIIHVPGYRLLVHPPFQRREFPTFTLNERIILNLSTRLGQCALILVAGWGVGSIALHLEPTLRDKKRFGPRARTLMYQPVPPVAVTKGQWISTFELGSTAILLFERKSAVKLEVGAPEQVRYGQPLFTCLD
jgi:phosphatidylserine decarboxylase